MRPRAPDLGCLAYAAANRPKLNMARIAIHEVILRQQQQTAPKAWSGIVSEHDRIDLTAEC